MGETAVGARVEFDPFAPEFLSDPYPTWRRIRERAPVLRTDFGFWLLTRYADCAEVLRDPAFGRGDFGERRRLQLGADRARIEASPLLQTQRRMMLFVGPPDHTRLRGLVNRAFTARTVEGLRPRIERIVEDLLDSAETRGAMDLMADVAFPLPVTVICEMLGVPSDDWAFFRERSREIAPTIEPVITMEILDRGDRATAESVAYFRDLVAERRRSPREDLISALIAAEDEGDRLTEDELLATIQLLFGAGHETTMNLIGNGMLALLRNPAELALLRDDPSLVPNAVEELLRYDGSVQITGRETLREVEVAGTRVGEGELVICALGAANRDPARYEDPDRLDVCRPDVRPLTFGAGAHFCLGAPLARLEAGIAIAALLRRFPRLALATDAPEFRPTITLRGLTALPLAF